MDRRTIKMMGIAGVLVMALGLIVTAGDNAAKDTEAAPKFEDQPKVIQRMFEKQSPNWVKIGDKLWSIEVMNQAEKRSRDEAYQDESAPWFYEPIGATRCRTLGEVFQKSVESGYKIDKQWQVMSKVPELGVKLYHRRHGLVLVKGLPEKVTTKTLPEGYIVKIGYVEYTTKQGEIKPYDHYEFRTDDQKPEAVTTQQLFDYCVANAIEEFPVLRVKTNIVREKIDYSSRHAPIRTSNSSGYRKVKVYVWINYPQHIIIK